jgi:hypothetical protein
MKTLTATMNSIKSTWPKLTRQLQVQTTERSEVCRHCGVEIASSRLSRREMALNAVCGSLPSLAWGRSC